MIFTVPPALLRFRHESAKNSGNLEKSEVKIKPPSPTSLRPAVAGLRRVERLRRAEEVGRQKKIKKGKPERCLGFRFDALDARELVEVPIE
jgi:hypothetical protein